MILSIHFVSDLRCVFLWPEKIEKDLELLKSNNTGLNKGHEVARPGYLSGVSLPFIIFKLFLVVENW